MEHAYKILYIFRPLIWGLVVILIGMFGNLFFRRLMNAIAIFLFVISIGGVWIVTKSIQTVLDPFSIPTTDDYTQCIIGTVMTLVFLLGAIGYMLIALVSDEKNAFAQKHKEQIMNFVTTVAVMVLPLSWMGFCIPFFLLKETAGKVFGVIAELAGIWFCVLAIRSLQRSKRKKLLNASEEETASEIKPDETEQDTTEDKR